MKIFGAEFPWMTTHLRRKYVMHSSERKSVPRLNLQTDIPQTTIYKVISKYL